MQSGQCDRDQLVVLSSQEKFGVRGPMSERLHSYLHGKHRRQILHKTVLDPNGNAGRSGAEDRPSSYR